MAHGEDSSTVHVLYVSSFCLISMEVLTYMRKVLSPISDTMMTTLTEKKSQQQTASSWEEKGKGSRQSLTT